MLKSVGSDWEHAVDPLDVVRSPRESFNLVVRYTGKPAGRMTTKYSMDLREVNLCERTASEPSHANTMGLLVKWRLHWLWRPIPQLLCERPNESSSESTQRLLFVCPPSVRSRA